MDQRYKCKVLNHKNSEMGFTGPKEIKGKARYTRDFWRRGMCNQAHILVADYYSKRIDILMVLALF